MASQWKCQLGPTEAITDTAIAMRVPIQKEHLDAQHLGFKHSAISISARRSFGTPAVHSVPPPRNRRGSPRLGRLRPNDAEHTDWRRPSRSPNGLTRKVGDPTKGGMAIAIR